jgi:hypothetical protein
MGMEDVLAAHTVHHYTWDYKEAGVNLASCECETLTVGRQDPSKLHAAHVAEALTAAGFGNLHDAWAEGAVTALCKTLVRNPYPAPKVSET